MEKGNSIRVLHYMTGMADVKAGIETYILNLYRKAEKAQLKFCVLTRNAKYGSAVYHEFLENGIEIFDLDCHNLNLKSVLGYYRKVKRFFESHRGAFDVLHMHGFDDPFVAYLAKRNGIKVCVLHAHSVERENKGILKNIFKNLASKGNMKCSDFRLACSDYAGKRMYGGATFEVVKNSISTEQFTFDSTTREEMRRTLNLKVEEIAFCYTGRFIAVKNLFFLLNVFEELVQVWKHARLFLMGDGEQKEKLISYIAKKNLQEKVVLLEQSNQVATVLQAMDVYLQTSLNEGFSISALEAQCIGLPVFVSDVFPQEIEVTDLIRKISLDYTAEEWAKEIISDLEKRENHDIDVRVSYSAIVRQRGYDSDTAFDEMNCRYRGNL